MTAVSLAGIGGYVPSRVVTNSELCHRLAVDEEWIRSRTGVIRRHIAGAGLATSDLAVAAGRRALRSAGITAVDAVLLATSTPDRLCPSTAPEVAYRLGLSPVAACDVAAVCAGFVYAMAIGRGLIASGVARRVLAIGADTYSMFTDPAEPAVAVIFGDGAGAAVLRASTAGDPGMIHAIDLGSDGAGSELAVIAAGGARERARGRPAVPADQFLALRGREIFRHAVLRMDESTRTVLSRAGWTVPQLGLLVAHQANQRIVQALARRLALPLARCACNIDQVGNTAAASIPLALVDAARSGQLSAGDKVVLTAFGGGLSWGSVALTWPALPSPPPASDDEPARPPLDTERTRHDGLSISGCPARLARLLRERKRARYRRSPVTVRGMAGPEKAERRMALRARSGDRATAVGGPSRRCRSPGTRYHFR